MSVELCSELMKKTKNKYVIPKFLIILPSHIQDSYLERKSHCTKMWSWFSRYQFYLHSALRRLSTTFFAQILRKIITFFRFEHFSNLCNSYL